jgi:UDP-glucose 4-epimerase
MNVLVTGGAGYIGSHTCVELLNAGHSLVVVDNLSNSSKESLLRVEHLTGREIPFHRVDLLDQATLEKVISANRFDAVIHFAALKAVGESIARPLEYYRNNLVGTVNLCELAVKYRIPNFVFSSSATVYGLPKQLPLTEDAPTLIHETTNPYGRSKLMMEFVLRDVFVANPQMNIALLRYFNPVGAHSSGLIGEDPNGLPNNLLPYVSQVAIGKLKLLQVYGDDYETPDGTGIRDYIHVVDLAVGHVKALDKLATQPGIVTYNLGTGQGYSVLEIVAAFEKASGRQVRYQIVGRRPGDVAACYANPALAKRELGWEAIRGLDEMCADSWRWQSMNPDGYQAQGS